MPEAGPNPYRDRPAMPQWREKMHEVIFEADTPMGKAFDVALLIAIIISVFAVMMDSVKEAHDQYSGLLDTIEWVFTILFTIEYIARIVSVGRPGRYIFSFFGIIDLLSLLPTFLGIFVVSAPSLMVIRTIRLLRVFRILKLARFMGEGRALSKAMKASQAKITVFLLMVLILVSIMGTIMYLIEGGQNGFTSIPRSIYWAIVTLTTVGYGDIVPHTWLGQTLASLIMILGYAIIAVPTGIVGAEIVRSEQKGKGMSTESCKQCSSEGHDSDADYCKFCGAKL